MEKPIEPPRQYNFYYDYGYQIDSDIPMSELLKYYNEFKLKALDKYVEHIKQYDLPNYRCDVVTDKNVTMNYINDDYNNELSFTIKASIDNPNYKKQYDEYLSKSIEYDKYINELRKKETEEYQKLKEIEKNKEKIKNKKHLNRLGRKINETLADDNLSDSEKVATIKKITKSFCSLCIKAGLESNDE